MNSIINFDNGHCVDHIAVGVKDTEEGVEWITELTGVKPSLVEPEPDQWYWSAALNLGKNCFLEIIGPNQNHKGFQPIKQMLKDFEVPSLFFWYIGTHNFELAKSIIEKYDFRLERIEDISYKRDDDIIDYKRAIIGRGFNSERPCIIQWNSRPKRLDAVKECSFKSLALSFPNPKNLNDLFSELQIDLQVKEGDAQMILTFDSPKGEIVLKGGGFEFSGLRAIPKMARLYTKYLSGL
ncbi:MAG: VOC family protein [Cyanobacteria bacterium P01_H01_bin.35]